RAGRIAMRGNAAKRGGIEVGGLPAQMRQPGGEVHSGLAAPACDFEHDAARGHDPAQDVENGAAIAQRGRRGEGGCRRMRCHAADPSHASRSGGSLLIELDRASRNHTVFAGATEIGPLMPKTATWNLSPALTLVLSTTRLGMFRPWIVAGDG